MDLSFFYYFFILFILLSIIDSTQFDSQCPTSRRLLLFGGSKSTNGGKKSSKSLPSSPPKYARSSDSHGLTVYIQPETSTELGQKVRSYSHLLKPKIRTSEEKARSKRSRVAAKKNSKKKITSPVAKTQELATTNDEELHRCQALLQIDSTAPKDDKKQKKTKGGKINRNATANKAKNVPTKAATPTRDPPKSEKKVKSTEQGSKPLKTQPVSPPPKSSASESTNPVKNKRMKPDTITIIQQTTIPFEADESLINEQNNSVVGRAFHFVKNIFQLSEDLLEENSDEDEAIIGLSNDQQQRHHHHSRKLLSIAENDNEPWSNSVGMPECEVDHSSFVVTSLSKRQLLAVKTSKQSASSSKSTNIKEKKQKSSSVKADENKPKVGWAYRYRISRYLAAQKMKRSGTKNKSSSITSKVSKRKLLEYPHDDEDQSSCQKDQISDESVIITETFHPKRQLLSSKAKDPPGNSEEIKARRRKKPIEDFTDPIVIVQSYDRGLYKPNVGWQFRYRVSRYIDSLRENIREDQKRLQKGLQDIQGKKSSDLPGKRKRPTETEQQSKKRQTPSAQKKKSTSQQKSRVEVEEEYIEGEKDLDPELRKINEEGRRVGWTYRYRIRRKLDHLKQIQAETGVPFDLATLSGKREKKGAHGKNHSIEKKSSEKSKPIVSKTRDEQKHEKSKKSEQIAAQDSQRTAGWRYRYRIRRKLDSSTSTATDDNENGKRETKSSSKKRQEKEDLIEETADLHDRTDDSQDINNSPVIRYFSRTSSYFLSMGKNILCLLPRSEPWTFCELENDKLNSSITQSTKTRVVKKLKTKKEQRAKQFIRSHTTKFGAEDKATERRVDETMKSLYRRPSLPPLQTPPSPTTSTSKKAPPKTSRRSLLKPGKSNPEEQIPTERIISVASKKNKNKKQYQIIGQEVKRRPKDLSPPSVRKTTRSPVELPKTTTPPPRLRTLSEVVRDEAATILAPIRSSSRTAEELQEEINETNESIQETKRIRTATNAKTPVVIDSTTSGEEDNESTLSTDNDSPSNQAKKLDLHKRNSSSL